MTGRLVVIGDVLLDRDVVGQVDRLCPDAPVPVLENIVEHARPGGAGLAAVLAAAGREVILVTAMSHDGAGHRLRSLLTGAGVTVVDLGVAGPTVEKVRVGAPGHALLRIDHGGKLPGRVGPLTGEGRAAIASASAVLVSDYGRGMAGGTDVRAALVDLPVSTPVVWDPHPRGAPPVVGVRLVTPNAGEAGVAVDASWTEIATAARALRSSWNAAGVAVTLGRSGALLVEGEGPPLAVPTSGVAYGDACGAGDRFASAAAGLLADGALPSEAVTGAVGAASAFVAAGGASTVLARPRSASTTSAGDAFGLATAVKARGGTVVATGGCFDILHAGHAAVLKAARALGDCLIVCLNSDDSVRRLKGPGRPLQPAADRRALLLALGCVDDVIVFDEDTPLAVLDRLRPNVFAKGADYSLATMPEAALLASWGGQAVVLPYLEGRSTTKLMKEAVRHADV